MGLLSDALRQAVETQEAETRAIISGLSDEGLVEWCRAEIENYENSFDPRKWAWEPFEIIRHSMTPDDHEAVVGLARKSHKWHTALIEFVRHCRRNRINVPERWITFLKEAKPDERGLERKTIRDEAVCRCIQYIIDFKTSTRATRNVESVHIISAADIVASALGYVQYSAVAKIWNNHVKRMKTDFS